MGKLTRKGLKAEISSLENDYNAVEASLNAKNAALGEALTGLQQAKDDNIRLSREVDNLRQERSGLRAELAKARANNTAVAGYIPPAPGNGLLNRARDYQRLLNRVTALADEISVRLHKDDMEGTDANRA